MNKYILFYICLSLFLSHVIYSEEKVVPLVIKGNKEYQDKVLKELIIQSENYHNSYVQIQDFYYDRFGFNKNSVFLGATDWFKGNLTVCINNYYSPISTQYDFMFWFSPTSDDIEAKKYVIDLIGKEYKNPTLINSIKGIYFVHQVTSTRTIHLFLVNEMTIEGKTYKGTLPNTISIY